MATTVERYEFFNEITGQALTRYRSAKGEISLKPGEYEIYCLEGDLFTDVEYFPTLAEAEARIYELLGD